MHPILLGLLVFASVFGAALLAMLIRRTLPPHHLSTDSRDVVKLSMGLVATMTALVLGLQVASAKGSYDAQKNAVTSMAAKITFCDRCLAMYGPEAAPARESLRQAVEYMVARTWPSTTGQPSRLDPHTASGEAAYHAIQRLSPQNEEQRALKNDVLRIAYDLGQMRWLLFQQSSSSIITPLLVAVIGWLAVLFFSFGMFAPANGTVITALLVTALSVAGALFLIMELDRPFAGMLGISSQPMMNALAQLGK